jgi:hypothetical protein
MREKNRFAKILKSKSGASLVMVLGITLLLLIVGVSALTAASANAGAALSQQVYNQLNLAAESVVRSIMHSLEASVDDEGSRVDCPCTDTDTCTCPETLGGQLIKALYQHNPANPFERLNLTAALNGAVIPVNIEITVDVPLADIDMDNADINFAEIYITVRVTRVPNPDSQDNRFVFYRLDYQLSGVEFRDDVGIRIENAGRWRVVDFEKIANTTP